MKLPNERTPSHRLGESAAFLDAVYGRCDARHGALIIVHPNRRRILRAFPLDSDSLVKAARCMQENPGSYYKVNPMSYARIEQRIGESGGRHAVGNASEVQSVVGFFADVDAGKDQRYASRKAALWAIDSMPVAANLVINSGGPDGGFHVVWLLDQPHLIEDEADRKRLAELSKSWQAKLRERLGGKLDNTSNLDRVLRCVGVKRLDSNDVNCERCQFDRLYSLEDFS